MERCLERAVALQVQRAPSRHAVDVMGAYRVQGRAAIWDLHRPERCTSTTASESHTRRLSMLRYVPSNIPELV